MSVPGGKHVKKSASLDGAFRLKGEKTPDFTEF